MRPLRFRLWDKKEKKFPSKLACNLHGEVFFLYGVGAMAPVGRQTIDYINEIDFHQYTGCVDVDNNEIYEGDVIESIASDGTSIRHLIWFNDARFVVVQTTHSDMIDGMSGLRQEWLIDHNKKVVGNIYENPELHVWNLEDLK